MAVVVESTSSGTNGPAVSNVSVTKPTGLAVGDLMACCVSANGAAGNPVLITPSGWTALSTQVSDQCESLFVYKVADASDVAASTFSFTATNSCNVVTAQLLRLSGHNASSPIGASNGTTGNTATVTISTITPLISDSLLIHCGSASAGTSVTFSAYAIATSNPTWTERYDGDGTDAMRAYMATASRPEITGTGNATVTIDNGVHQWRGYIVSIRAADPNISAGFTLATSVPTPTVPTAATVSAGFTAATSALAPTIATVDPDWTNSAKNSASATNTSKNAATATNTSKNAATFTNTAKS